MVFFSVFNVKEESDNYRLQVSGYTGTAGDSMDSSHPQNGMQFTTIDRDNDR